MRFSFIGPSDGFALRYLQYIRRLYPTKMNLFNNDIIYRCFRVILSWENYKKYLLAAIVILAYKVALVGFLYHYFITDFTVWTAIVMVPYVAKPNTNEVGKKRYGWLSMAFLFFTFLTGVQTFYFLAIGFAILFVLESLAGSIGYLPFFLLSLISPTFRYFDNMLGFPVRLKLSEWVGNILQHLGYQIKVTGNVFEMNGSEFAVDPACVGLKMMAVSFLIGIVLLSYYEHRERKKFSFLTILLLLVTIIFLNIISNLIRILVLAIFCILPENPAHDVVGMICLLLYVIFPMFILVKLTSKKWRMRRKKEDLSHQSTKRIILFNGLLLFLILLAGFLKINTMEEPTWVLPSLGLHGYSKKAVTDGVLKLEKPGILVYVKPMQRFYGAEHNPMICWVGSGYEFRRINKKNVRDKVVFTGILKKGTDVIYAAWWFDSGKYQTTEQLDWRIQALKGEHFFLVNVNSGSEKQLWEEVKMLTEK